MSKPLRSFARTQNGTQIVHIFNVKLRFVHHPKIQHLERDMNVCIGIWNGSQARETTNKSLTPPAQMPQAFLVAIVSGNRCEFPWICPFLMPAQCEPAWSSFLFIATATNAIQSFHLVGSERVFCFVAQKHLFCLCVGRRHSNWFDEAATMMSWRLSARIYVEGANVCAPPGNLCGAGNS